ncbi:MAG: hypothetical protein K9I94_12885 [Bacteroidales bacterium]|nr:hypothetical protein [Bacteroidales bacterium]
MKKTGIGILILFLVCVTTAQAGWEITETNLTEGYQIIYSIEGTKVKVFSPKTVYMMDFNSGQVTYINRERKYYWQGSLDSLKTEVLKIIETEKLENQQQGRGVMKTQKAAMFDFLSMIYENLGNGIKKEETLDSLRIKVEQLTEGTKIVNRVAQKFTVKQDKELKEEHWIGEDFNYPKSIDWPVLITVMNNFPPDMTGKYGYRNTPDFLNMRKRGFSLRRVIHTTRPPKFIEVTGFEKKQIDPETFLVPDAYEKITIDKLMKNQKYFK